jgi:acetyl-CoA decarbonylase/synthase complex subunit delta
VGRVKEAVSPQQENPEWGDATIRGPLWESATVVSYVEAGAELLILRNPDALQQAKAALQTMWPAAE